MIKDTYSLREKGKKYESPINLFESLNGRLPKQDEFISCYVHSSIMNKSFLKTYYFGVK